MWEYKDTEELYHWGVKGMKWGKTKATVTEKPTERKSAISQVGSAALYEDETGGAPADYKNKIKDNPGAEGGFIDDDGIWYNVKSKNEAIKRKWEWDKKKVEAKLEVQKKYAKSKTPLGQLKTETKKGISFVKSKLKNLTK